MPSLPHRVGAHVNCHLETGQPIGPLTQITVQRGDTLRVSAPGRYQQAVANHSFAFSLVSFVASLLQPAPAGGPPRADGSKRGGLPLLQVGLNAGSLAALTQTNNGVPKGYLRVLVFNQDSVLVDQRTVQLSQAALHNYEVLQTGFLPIQQDGYVSVYVGNESAVDVLFDDVQVEYRQGLLVQETHYDPAGLELAGLAPPSPGIRGLNNYRFNGKEFQADLGLAWNHQDWRFFDPQLLRWHSGDPELENGQESWTPYSFGYDNAVRYADADGRCPGGCPTSGTDVAADLRSMGSAAVSAVVNWFNTPVSPHMQEMGRGLNESLTGRDIPTITRWDYMLAVLGQAAANYHGPAPGSYNRKQSFPARVTPAGVSRKNFAAGSKAIRAAAGHLSEDIVVQGSRANGTNRPDSDIDIAIKMQDEEFNAFLQERFGNPNPGSAKEKTKNWAIKKGKIAAGEAGLRPLRKKTADAMGVPKADVSVVKKNGPFDNGAQIPLKK